MRQTKNRTCSLCNIISVGREREICYGCETRQIQFITNGRENAERHLKKRKRRQKKGVKRRGRNF